MKLEDLPILLERWLYEASQTTRKQYQILNSHGKRDFCQKDWLGM